VGISPLFKGTPRAVPDTEDFWKRPGKVVLAGAAYRVFRSTLQGLNQSIVGLSQLSETA
jgi:hypothetical protein